MTISLLENLQICAEIIVIYLQYDLWTFIRFQTGGFTVQWHMLASEKNEKLLVSILLLTVKRWHNNHITAVCEQNWTKKIVIYLWGHECLTEFTSVLSLAISCLCCAALLFMSHMPHLSWTQNKKICAVTAGVSHKGSNHESAEAIYHQNFTSAQIYKHLILHRVSPALP